MNSNYETAAYPEYAQIPDQANGTTIDFGSQGIAMMLSDGTGGKTFKLPDDDGFMLVLTNTAGSGDILLTDVDSDVTGTVSTDETGLFVRTGSSAAGMKWKCVLLKSSVT